MTTNAKPISYTQEVCRKLVHMSSLWIVAIYYLYGKDTTLDILIPVTLIVLLIDGARRCTGTMCPMCETIIGYFLRNHERAKLSGASYLMVSALIVVLLFPEPIAITALSILLISDSVAALVGRKFGIIRFRNGQSLLGSLSFFLSATAVVYMVHTVYELDQLFVLSGLLAAMVATLMEAFSPSLKVDDNFTIPLSASIIMLLVQWSIGA